ncbi:protein FAM114A2 [Apis dorsata]|uniref:protein FAM114A2 n=1 Tax=Apis dorsata TaxID=7462 RepID=UPI0003DF56E6|nr:protein FAM114A2 [Apis dorsata]
MATSESDDFESADEEMNHDIPTKKCIQTKWNLPTTIDSESDDDTEYLPRQPHTNISFGREKEKYCSMIDTAIDKKNFDKNININDTYNYKHEQPIINVNKTCDKIDEDTIILNSQKIEYLQTNIDTINLKVENNNKTIELDKNEIDTSLKMDINMELYSETSKLNEKERIHKEQNLYKKKLGTNIIPTNNLTTNIINMNTNINEKNIPMTKENVMFDKTFITDEITESEMPEEMKSNKTFKEIFKPQGWEGLGDAIELPKELTEEKLQPLLKRLSLSEQIDDSSNWGWANWGVSSLINTATAGVSTLTSHVSQGLTLLEESMTISEEPKPITNEEKQNNIVNDDNKNYQFKEQSSFGFGNLISSVSSITKLVESTGSKVMSGGLDTLEAIGKKTMEVLQEGDPGLKKKRAFFINEPNKPNLSQILREAKEKAENVEKTIEEKQKMRKVHFESLFDDYQGLVHIEALEMLSKQSNIKIQQHLNGLDINELNSVQKMLEEVEELCELGEDENDDETHEKDLKYKLKQAICDLGINITYDKLYEICQNSQVYITQSMTYTNQEIFEHAISVLAQFTAVSVERFHKTAGLLLIKEHRSTVNETDSLVQLTNILSNQIGILTNTYCNILSKLAEISDKSDNINSNITTIFMEASNASSYIQHAFKLLIPIIQVGAI